MGETFLFLQKLLKNTNGILLSRVDCASTALRDYMEEHTAYICRFFFPREHPVWQQPERLAKQEDRLYQWVIPSGITFLLYPAGNFCFGPVLTHPFSREEALRLLEPYNFKSQVKSEILQFCETLSVVEPHTFQRIAALVTAHLTGREEISQFEHMQSPTVQLQLQRSQFSPEEDIVQMRQVETRYEHSAALTDAVSQGNLSLALHIISNYNPGIQTTIRNSNPLRNAQNYCIVLNTQLRHALEKTGIHPYQVDRLSNRIGLEIEQLKSTKQLPQFFQQVLARYCRLVQEHTYPDLKPLTHLAVNYIKEHLADNLTVKDTAAVLTVNANYLSNLFHKDMGITFIDFVNRERTRQAAALLQHTNLQIQQIASTVGYNNTSYFAKQFLRFYGMPPSQYRQ